MCEPLQAVGKASGTHEVLVFLYMGEFINLCDAIYFFICFLIQC